MARSNRPVAATVAVVAVLAACSGGGDPPAASATPSPSSTDATAPVATTSTVPATLPLADEALDDPEVTTVASDLASSQVAASTVPEPPTPGPCALSDVAMWTARVEPRADAVSSVADAVIRVVNTSDDWCEPDIGRSPLLDPAVEPDVWLFPGDEADLFVGQQVTECGEPSLVPLVQVGIGDESAVVPSAAISCGWWLNAFVPLGSTVGPCDVADLEFAITERAIVVRTTGDDCELGTVSDVDGNEIAIPGERSASPISVLRRGDVAMIAEVGTGDACDDPPAEVIVEFNGAGRVTVADVPCSTEWWPVAGPWFGTPFGPTAEMTTGPLAVAVALDALDPFD